PVYAARAVVCDLAQRRLLSRVVRDLHIVGARACVAGGFAAWQLERYLEVAAGRDGFPHASRFTHVVNTTWRNDVWMPQDVDLFVTTEDAELTLNLVTNAYRDFLFALYANAGDMRIVASSLEYHEGSDRPPPPPNVVRDLARLHELPEIVVDACVAATHDVRRVDPPPRQLVRSSWNILSTIDEPYVPMRLNVVLTDGGLDAPDYARWVTAHFDLLHCAVSCTVDADGEYHFRASSAAVHALARRRLEFTPHAFLGVNTIRRVCKYLANGFSITGDAGVPVSDDVAIDSCDAIV
ncbi:MAG: hypothetical protein VXX04_00240, partial [Actinomycetota bacterium]|nr:hypothetical protein [Actinomycetota bacterium]